MNFESFTSFVSNLLMPTLTLLISSISLFFSIRANRANISRERLEKAYHPLFLSIEPFLYKNVCYAEIETFLTCFKNIEKNYPLFIQPYLKQLIHAITPDTDLNYVDKYLSQSIWFDICDAISNEYDYLCKLSNIPLRSIAYRLDAEQYKSKLQFVILLLRLNLFNLLLITIFLAVFAPNF